MPGELINCLGCGRDTRSKTGYCHRCTAQGVSSMPGEDKDRPARDVRVSAPHEDDYSEAYNPQRFRWDLRKDR